MDRVRPETRYVRQGPVRLLIERPHRVVHLRLCLRHPDTERTDLPWLPHLLELALVLGLEESFLSVAELAG